MAAGFWIRCKAFLIDYLLILCYLLVLTVFGLFVFPGAQRWFEGSLAAAQLAGFLLVTLPVSAYFIVSESLAGGGQSFGKRKAGIRVVDERGRAPSVPRAVLRTAVKFLPWELSHFLVYRLVSFGDDEVPVGIMLVGGAVYALIFAYILTALFTVRKQSVYDLVAKTRVIRTAPEERNGNFS